MRNIEMANVSRSIANLKSKFMTIKTLNARADYLSQARVLIREHYNQQDSTSDSIKL
ncbi:hypothetical protein OAO18_07870 [Francisellaceae bacterium]|nr:hypothetical protein [Francisellaceae bacterium]